MKKRSRASKVLIFFCIVAGMVGQLWASYDRYAPSQAVPGGSSGVKKNLLRLPLLPFELLRWPVDKSLVYVEKHHLHKKALWIYDEIRERGIYPKANVISFGSLGGGTDLDFVRLLRMRERFPDAVAKSWIHYTQGVYFKTGAQLGLDRIARTGFYSHGIFDYEYRPQEHFYGIGPKTSAGEGSVYAMETTKLAFSSGYRPNPLYDFNFGFAYSNIDVSGGKDGGRGRIGEGIFTREKTPALDGDSLISLKFQFERDTRNAEKNSTGGSIQRVGIGYNEGLGSSDARYLKYEAEAAQYIPLGSVRRILALHVYGEHNDEIGGDDSYIPFHEMAKLGGYGVFPRLSHTLRGFDFNRFTDESALLLNLEYRYTIWEYKDFKMDTILFWDEGQVFGEISEFQLKNFRESYGLGFRLCAAKITLFSIAVAHGDEGTRFYVKSGAAF